jgi:putative transposase
MFLRLTTSVPFFAKSLRYSKPGGRRSHHDVFIGIAPSAQERARTYREWLHAGINDEDIQRIREHLRQEKVLGSPQFQAMVEKTLGRPVAARPQGRPKKDAC